MGLGGQSEIRMMGRICTTRPNYVAPEDSGAKAYHLLLEAMLESGFAVIAKVLMHSRENIVIIRVY
jgi:non-homologous end joining protein Ku